MFNNELFQKKLFIIFILFIVAILSCIGILKKLNTTSTMNVYNETFLFEKDGCSIYRFYDEGLPRYFGKCNRTSSAVVWEENRPFGVVLKMSIVTE